MPFSNASSNRSRYASCVGYIRDSTGSGVGEGSAGPPSHGSESPFHSSVLPNKRQNPGPPAGSRTPFSVRTGTSTWGVRTPPTTIPVSGSRRSSPPSTASGGPLGGGGPPAIHCFRWRSAARIGYVIGPSLIGTLSSGSGSSQVNASRPTPPPVRRYRSACAVPASSQVLIRSVSGCRAAMNLGTSPSASIVNTGTSRSPRIRAGLGVGTVGRFSASCASGADPPDRLWMKNPSYTRASGCTALT